MSNYEGPIELEGQAKQLAQRGLRECQRNAKFHTQAATCAAENMNDRALEHHLKDAATWALAAYFAHIGVK